MCIFSVHFDLENGAIYDDDVYAAMQTAIMAISASPQRMTNIAHALNYVAAMVFSNHGDRRNAGDVIIMFTDGEVSNAGDVIILFMDEDAFKFDDYSVVE